MYMCMCVNTYMCVCIYIYIYIYRWASARLMDSRHFGPSCTSVRRLVCGGQLLGLVCCMPNGRIPSRRASETGSCFSGITSSPCSECPSRRLRQGSIGQLIPMESLSLSYRWATQRDPTPRNIYNDC